MVDAPSHQVAHAVLLSHFPNRRSYHGIIPTPGEINQGSSSGQGRARRYSGSESSLVHLSNLSYSSSPRRRPLGLLYDVDGRCLLQPGVYSFSELLDLPNIQALTDDEANSQSFALLQLFAYGTLKDYNGKLYFLFILVVSS